MQRFEVTSPLSFNEVEFYKFQIGLFLSKVILTDTQKSVLVYFYLYPDPVSKLVIEGLFKSEKSVQNYVSELRKKKLLVGKGKATKINPSINLKTESFQVTLNIIKENE